MNSTIKIICVLLFGFFITDSTAQDIDCNSFCVKNIRMDSLTTNIMIVTIFFEGDDNDFINYPHVALVIDRLGDTVATGTLNFFGQVGNTAQDYPVTTELDSVPSDFEAYVHFNYDTSMCILTYPCTTSAVTTPIDLLKFTIYPNPFSTETVIQFDRYIEDISVNVFNTQGIQVCEIKNIYGNEVILPGNGMSRGIYFVQVFQETKIIGTRKISIVD